MGTTEVVASGSSTIALMRGRRSRNSGKPMRTAWWSKPTTLAVSCASWISSASSWPENPTVKAFIL